jgi:hypothetical protein
MTWVDKLDFGVLLAAGWSCVLVLVAVVMRLT